MYSRLFETSHPNAATGSPWAQSTESGSMSWFLCSSVDLSAGYDAAVHHHVRTMMLPSENIVTVTTGCIDWNFSFCNVCFPESFSYCMFYEWLRHDLIGSESQQEETAGIAADAAWAGFAYMPSWIWIWAVWHCDEWSLRSALVTSMLFPPSLILKKLKLTTWDKEQQHTSDSSVSYCIFLFSGTVESHFWWPVSELVTFMDVLMLQIRYSSLETVHHKPYCILKLDFFFKCSM